MGLFWNGRYVLCGHVHETTGALKQIFRGIMAGFVQTCGVLFNQHTPHGQLLRGGDSLFSDATTYSEYCWILLACICLCICSYIWSSAPSKTPYFTKITFCVCFHSTSSSYPFLSWNIWMLCWRFLIML